MPDTSNITSITVNTYAQAASTEKIEMGTSNVFADLGLSDPDERRLRVQLATRLNDLLQAEGLTQAAAAKLLGIAQPHVSELKNYKLSRFSSGRLSKLLRITPPEQSAL